MRLGVMWVTDQTTGTSTPWPSRGRCNSNFPSRRVGLPSPAWPPLPFCFSHPGSGGPAVLDQETPGGEVPQGKPGKSLSYAACWAVSSAGSSLMPGPMVVLTVTPFRYTPLAVWGRALKMTSMMALKLSFSFSGGKEALPNGT